MHNWKFRMYDRKYKNEHLKINKQSVSSISKRGKSQSIFENNVSSVKRN